MEHPRPAREVPLERLLELVQMVRRELVLREESPTGDWVEETAQGLHSGAQAGWCYPSPEADGLAFFSTRAGAAFGHVHVGGGPGALARATKLAETLIDQLAPDIRSVDLGFTGLTTDDDHSLLSTLAQRPGSFVIEREAMERALGPADAEPPARPAPDMLHVAIRDVTLDALAHLDVRAFQGSTDELLIGHEVADYRRVLETLLGGGMGRFLDEASTALIEPHPTRLIGAILSSEQSPRRAVFLDFMVDPERRGRGYGRYLLRWGLRALWALGYERVRLWVTVSNGPARHLYDELGFRRTATAMIYRWERPSSTPHPQAPR
ncbi:MAG TPA: GNAT family N-acetyltransferase [Thermoplasmata archaeon]|nr:GNAT family N-acetyltransferase [Thermoplasmata archaeon]